ncbi:MAG: PaaI family thioesterase [Bdellovibrionota bacterium]
MTTAIQDQTANRSCYGCGAENPHGLQLKSVMVGDEAKASFQPKPFHTGGFPGHVYGGLICSLLDCHSANFAIAWFYADEKRPIGTEPLIHCVTAQLNISLLKPARIDLPIELSAEMKSVEGRKMWVRAQAFSGGEKCADAEILAVRLKPEQAEAMLSKS